MTTTAGYDHIIVGAGTAGSVLAARLSADPGRRVLLLEAGPDYPDPATYPADLAGGSVLPVGGQWDWGLTATLVGQRRGPLSRGRVVGGSAQINDRGAWRPPAADFDDWAALGLPDWGWPRVLESFRRLEDDQQYGDRPHHGTGGPVPITRWPRQQWLPAMAALLADATAAGHPYCEDLNAPDAHGIGPYPHNRVGTLRASSAHTHLRPARARGNLTVRGGVLVERVLLEGDRAVGVVADGAEIRGRQVTLCAGAPFTPALLLRSGIGAADALRGLGITPRVELPGVGQRLIDQPGAAIPVVPTAAAGSPEWPRTQLAARFAALPGHQADHAYYLCLFSGMRIPELDQAAGQPVPTLLMVGDLRPASRGRMWLTSADPAALPEVELGFYTAPGDLERMVAAYRGAWQLAQGEHFRRTVAAFPLLDDALVGDDQALGGMLRQTTTSRWNLLGGATMGPDSDPLAVVDQHCRVRGMAGLHVADASIVPVPLRAPAALACFMLGDLGADQILAGSP